MAQKAMEWHAVSIRFACECLGVSPSCYYSRAKHSTENALIADWLLR
jgi:putative transposase